MAAETNTAAAAATPARLLPKCKIFSNSHSCVDHPQPPPHPAHTLPHNPPQASPALPPRSLPPSLPSVCSSADQLQQARDQFLERYRINARAANIHISPQRRTYVRWRGSCCCTTRGFNCVTVEYQRHTLKRPCGESDTPKKHTRVENNIKRRKRGYHSNTLHVPAET